MLKELKNLKRMTRKQSRNDIRQTMHKMWPSRYEAIETITFMQPKQYTPFVDKKSRQAGWWAAVQASC